MRGFFFFFFLLVHVYITVSLVEKIPPYIEICFKWGQAVKGIVEKSSTINTITTEVGYGEGEWHYFSNLVHI